MAVWLYSITAKSIQREYRLLTRQFSLLVVLPPQRFIQVTGRCITSILNSFSSDVGLLYFDCLSCSKTPIQ